MHIFFLLLASPTTIQLVSVCQVSTSSTRSNHTVMFKFLPVFYGQLKYHYDMLFSKKYRYTLISPVLIRKGEQEWNYD